MTLIQVLEIGLSNKGYGGLFHEERCGCKIGDLSPANCMDESCEPGYLQFHDSADKTTWVITRDPKILTADEIDQFIKEFT